MQPNIPKFYHFARSPFFRWLGVAVLLVTMLASIHPQNIAAGGQTANFKVGEKLSYSVSFENIKDAAYFETSVASQGKLGGRDAVELRGRLKTFELVSAAFRLIDERRDVFVDPASGLPLMISRTTFDGVLPKENTESFLTAPTSNFDLLSALYAVRYAGGNGSFPIFEDGETSILTAQTTGRGQKLRIELGDFDTTISAVTGPFLESRGIRELLINFGIDDDRLPLRIRVKTARGLFVATLTAVQNAPPEVRVPSPTPTPAKTPTPVQTPRPQPTPTPYIDDQPLLPELSFALGEAADYHVTRGGKQVATLRLSAAERRLFNKRDALKLTATVTGVDQGNTVFALGDAMTTYVVPETLAPIQSEMKFAGLLKDLSQTATFDGRNGGVLFTPAKAIDAPIGTHTILSLIYAMRSFNLRPSKDPANPVNDTRVAVFWRERPYIFTLRPSQPDPISIDGEKVDAQLITINTGSPELDQLAFRVWLSTDERRIPLRFSVGGYQADLVSVTNILADR